jgi:HK97 gp10 family phage protein
MATLEGFDELQEKLKQLSYIAQRQTMTAAIRAGAEVVAAGAAAMAPRRTGRLSTNIVVVTAGREQTLDQVTAKIGPSKTAYYGRFVEKGTIHMRARPFLAPALEQNIERAVEAASEVLREAIERVAQ